MLSFAKEIETSAVVADTLKNYISILSFGMEFTEREGEEGGRVGGKRERVKRTLLIGGASSRERYPFSSSTCFCVSLSGSTKATQ